jgi:hypothetical protein
MSIYTSTLISVINEGLSALSNSVESGKTPNNPVSRTHYLHTWISQAIKLQSFDTGILKTLQLWQQHARTTGTKSGLVRQFERLQVLFSSVDSVELNKKLLEGALNTLAEKGWLLTTDHPILRKVSHATQGQASLVICCEQWQKAFDENGVWVKPFSFYVRGDHDALLQDVHQMGLLLFKVTDYKSLVKFHGEYRLFPENHGDRVPELPLFD